MMNKNSVLLSIGAALLGSLFVADLGHAAQTEKETGCSLPDGSGNERNSERTNHTSIEYSESLSCGWKGEE